MSNHNPAIRARLRELAVKHGIHKAVPARAPRPPVEIRAPELLGPFGALHDDDEARVHRQDGGSIVDFYEED
jgi:hypothetical protein